MHAHQTLSKNIDTSDIDTLIQGSIESPVSCVPSSRLLQVLVQELGVKVDMSFIMAILELLADLPTTASEVLHHVELC